ncbi:MAG: class I SAM-dependent methyltransferase [Anaerolineae bacterium]|nr:class I SAM-dependent methyltransferase [Anaerolineae bacterium]
MSIRTQVELFDDWAENYDRSVESAGGVFEGYAQVLDLIVRSANARSGMCVLDLGTGTGNLAQHFIRLGCEVWGTDFSPAMLAKARPKIPQATLVEMDLLQDAWPGELDGQRFDRIVSAYVFHHFDLRTKVRLLERLADHTLADRGRIVIGDIAFPSEQALKQAGADHWDEDEHYWAADETISACREIGLAVTYTQVSSCGGVFVIERA